MTNNDLLLILMGPLAGFATGMVVFLIARRAHRRSLAAHPDAGLPSAKESGRVA
jgi:hypothetical protein